MTDQPIALITGAAQGIGYASAEAIAESGAASFWPISTRPASRPPRRSWVAAPSP
jgi:NAD(P)-dependent dehydrogenase (short-subunit alcohol dehydrogenase family)